jgi:dTDP-4-amino-4,6-dideoxygalactose transaminase
MFMQRMLDAGIATRRGVMNAHRERAYPAGTWRSAGGLSQSEEAQDTTVILPLFHQLTEEDQHRVIDTIARVMRDV